MSEKYTKGEPAVDSPVLSGGYLDPSQAHHFENFTWEAPKGQHIPKALSPISKAQQGPPDDIANAEQSGHGNLSPQHSAHTSPERNSVAEADMMFELSPSLGAQSHGSKAVVPTPIDLAAADDDEDVGLSWEDM